MHACMYIYSSIIVLFSLFHLCVYSFHFWHLLFPLEYLLINLLFQLYYKQWTNSLGLKSFLCCACWGPKLVAQFMCVLKQIFYWMWTNKTEKHAPDDFWYGTYSILLSLWAYGHHTAITCIYAFPISHKPN